MCGIYTIPLHPTLLRAGCLSTGGAGIKLSAG
jgi:hypothetical protein